MRARASSLPCAVVLGQPSSPPMRTDRRRGAARGRRGSLPSRPAVLQASIPHSVSCSGELGGQLELVGPVGPHDHAGHAGRHDAARVPLRADARRRSHQRALQQRLVGHRCDRLLASTGEEQLLDARGVVGEAALRHRFHVVVVRLAAIPPTYVARYGRMLSSQPLTSSVIFTVRPLKTSKAALRSFSGPSARRANPCPSAAATSGSSVPAAAGPSAATRRRAPRTTRCSSVRPRRARSGFGTAGA